jgi:pimeloyl-ACP methyl ester carboxylesterase
MGRKVALAIHAIGASHTMYYVSPIDETNGIASFLLGKAIEVRTPTLHGHCSSYQDLAKTTGKLWVEQVTNEMEELIQERENERVYLIGFSMGSLLILLSLMELVRKQKCTMEQLSRVRVLCVNTPVEICGVSTSLLKRISKMPRGLLEKIWLPNVPRPWEPNRQYLKQAMTSKRLPISSVVEMMKLVWHLLDMPLSLPLRERLSDLVLVQAIPDKVVHPRSVSVLHEMFGGEVITIKGATHGFPERKPWLELMGVLDRFTD